MKLEAVIVCVDYSDFLAHTLPSNLNHLDNVVIVTTPEDKDTQALCNKYSVKCIDTRVFYENGDKLNKGRGINVGLSNLRHDDWLLHIDADILLPDRFRHLLRHNVLDENVLYGADRVHTVSYEAFKNHHSPLQYKYNCKLEMPEQFPMGARLIPGDYGYTPIGYFQMFHKSQNRKYPVNCGSAEHSDVMFAVQWDRNNRRILPEAVVTHLDSESPTALFSANWKGRTTKQFCPCHPRHHHHPYRPPYCR